MKRHMKHEAMPVVTLRKEARLHWGVAAIVVALFALGIATDQLAGGMHAGVYAALLGAHVALGLMLVAGSAYAGITRMLHSSRTNGRAKLVNSAFGFLMLVVPLAGLAALLLHGAGAASAAMLHGVFAAALLGLVVLHAGTALVAQLRLARFTTA